MRVARKLVAPVETSQSEFLEAVGEPTQLRQLQNEARVHKEKLLPALTDVLTAIPAKETRFLTPEEAARFLGGLNSRTVTRWAREKYLPAYPIGEGRRRLWRFLRSDLETWMTARRQVANVY
jgi:excisionase family DNA binding protein